MPLHIPTPRILSAQYSNTDSLIAATGTSEQFFATQYTFPANYFVSGRLVRVTIGLETTTSSGAPAAKFRWVLTSTTPTTVAIYDTGNAFTMLATLTLDSFGASWLMRGTAPPGAAVGIDTATLNAWFNSNFFGRNVGASALQTIETNLANTLKLGIAFSATTAGNTVWLRQMLIEELQ